MFRKQSFLNRISFISANRAKIVRLAIRGVIRHKLDKHRSAVQNRITLKQKPVCLP